MVTRTSPSLIDVLDRVLAKGIVISYEMDVAILGLHAIAMDGTVVIQSLDMYLKRQPAPASEAVTSPALDAAVSAYLRRLPYGDALGPMA